MNVSPDFSLPLRVVAPYFLAGTFFYALSMGYLWFIDPAVSAGDMRVLGWVHAYMVGFVMSVIAGAMGQLSVVVGEVHHRYPVLFVWIAPMLGVGSVLLAAGFIRDPAWLLAGGVLIVAALALFAFDLFVTVRRSRRRTAVTRSMQWSTFFLGIGLAVGIAMAGGYAGAWVIDPLRWLYAHLMSVLGGYVLLNVMGVSTVLLPMFGACERFSDNDHALSFYAMIAAVLTMMLAALLQIGWLEGVSLGAALFSVLYYLRVVYRIFTSKKRRYADIWERSTAVAFMALVAALALALYAYVEGNGRYWLIVYWLLMAGFIGFLITGHLYKIVPFLVWFERFAPRIDDEEVPMIHQLLPARWADAQWGSALAGVAAIAVSLWSQSVWLWQTGAVLLFVSGVLLVAIIVKVLRYRV
ncbi:MAG: hypothetical protein AB1763_01890 [Campylobacterota bacterium]